MTHCMKLRTAWALLLLAAGAAPVQAQLALAQQKNCLGCHAVEKRVLGPAYKEIAAKYRSDKAAEANLVKKVKAGGSGVWGPTPMPPNAHVKEDDIKTLVQWILATK